MIKAIFFDLDNTLVSTIDMKKKASRAAIRAMMKAGLRISEKKGWDILNEMFEEHGMEDQKIFNKFLKKTTGKVDMKILAAGVVAYRNVKRKTLKIYPNVKRTLSRLSKKYKIVIITDAPKFQAWTRLYELGLENHFDFVIAFEDTGVIKPEKLPFRKALNTLKLKANQVVMVGDSKKRDIVPANKMGMTTVLAKYGDVWKGRGTPDYEIDNIKELAEIISNINS